MIPLFSFPLPLNQYYTITVALYQGTQYLSFTVATNSEPTIPLAGGSMCRTGMVLGLGEGYMERYRHDLFKILHPLQTGMKVHT